MLYDPRWQQDRDKLFSFPTFKGWLERQCRPRKRYAWNDGCGCLLSEGVDAAVAFYQKERPNATAREIRIVALFLAQLRRG